MPAPAECLQTMCAARPLVQNITNYVAMNVMANVLLAAGASPAMVHAREEAAEFAVIAQALTVNIGTADPTWIAAMEDAVTVMNQHNKPWVLDPVAAGATAFRRDATARLLALKPTVIRGNASEILALAGQIAGGRGADTGDTVEAAHDAAQSLARKTGGVVAVTGAVDFITDGTQALQVANGDPLMPKVTALGCALTGVVGAFCVGQPPLDATVAALAYYGLAGEIAAKSANGPGSFQPHFLDALHCTTPNQLTAGANVARL